MKARLLILTCLLLGGCESAAQQEAEAKFAAESYARAVSILQQQIEACTARGGIPILSWWDDLHFQRCEGVQVK